VKAFGGQFCRGSIIVRQRGTKIKPGTNVASAKDDTLFRQVNRRHWNFGDRGTMGKFVSIVAAE